MLELILFPVFFHAVHTFAIEVSMTHEQKIVRCERIVEQMHNSYRKQYEGVCTE